ncbi:hypothetical protein NIES22_73360 (plasmid) [Calothrix brevissima NIES-22]|nr:hypothetical protein NIES22_73360 [Calothrix brevissima NIES-22]
MLNIERALKQDRLLRAREVEENLSGYYDQD